MARKWSLCIKILNVSFVCLFLLILLTVLSQSKAKSQGRPLRWVTKPEALEYLTRDMTDMDTFKRDILDPLLIERISGTPGNTQAKEHIVKHMKALGWTVEEDSFEDDTPFGRKQFTNIIATFNPNKPKKVILACHFDSKDFRTEENFEFIGAIDSAVPCAILIETARQLDCLLLKGPREKSAGEDLTLQLVFFDGEEAFKHWTATDSIYGARHLATKWEEENKLADIRELILLDLIGTRDTRFVSHFDSTQSLYEHLVKVEKHLRSNKLLSGKHPETIFTDFKPFGRGGIEDDHVPFLRKGVNILHLISTPFPSVWHKKSDNGDNLDYGLIDDFSRIFRVFVSNLLHLSPEKLGCRKRSEPIDRDL